MDIRQAYWRFIENVKNRQKAIATKKNLQNELRLASGLNIYRCDSVNIGDRYSGPSRYFGELKEYSAIDIFRFNRPFRFEHGPIIVGGGGLLHEGFFGKRLEMIVKSKPKALIAWGIGYNTDIGEPQWKPGFLDDFSLVGLRDADTPYDWVPCSSCMHPLFDSDYPVLHPVVMYNHWEYGVEKPFAMPELRNNTASFDEIIKFLASGEIVITTSFHGAYWATLLGRRVIVVEPFSWKFYTFRHPPVIAKASQLRHAMSQACPYPQALKECREANERFGSKVFELLGDV